MSSVCILTDSTAQFAKSTFPGRDLVAVVPFQIEPEEFADDDNELKVADLPPTTQAHAIPKLSAPTVEDFRKRYISLSQDFNEILAVTLSAELSPTFAHAVEAAEAVRGRVSVQVIDSQTTSVGLGMLVQSAAEAANRSVQSTEIERMMRGAIPHIYTVMCIPSLTYLDHSGFIGPAQAIVGEMLGLLPIFTLEDGRLTPVEKARNYRQLMDYLQEFLDEFSDLYHIAFIQSVPPMTHEARILREHAGDLFPKTPFSEHPINSTLALMFGPRTLAVFAMEIPDER
jgi:DegV family protein with EDD domain